jgi:hypothetical protein
MDWTAILSAIRRENADGDRRLAEQARKEYGSNFPQAFSYRKGGQTRTYQKDAEVARRYRQLKGIGEESD